MRLLSNKEKKEFIEQLEKTLKIELKIKKEDIYFLEKEKIYLLNKIPIAVKYDNMIIPTIFLIVNLDIFLPYVKVDSGAKDKILTGADVFRPGIIEFSKDIKKNDIVLILSENNELLGIGLSLLDAKEIENIEKGKVIKNVHYYGDKITKLYKELNK